MAETLKLEIVTPQGVVFSEDVTLVTLTGSEGQMGIYPHHMRLITMLVPGELSITQNGEERLLAVGEGLADISGERVAVVTDMAIRAEHIDEAQVEAARERAAARLREKISDEEVASVNASLARSLAQLQVKKRRRM
jgi:F-type H+-transporting ATPase subunit epsilon